MSSERFSMSSELLLLCHCDDLICHRNDLLTPRSVLHYVVGTTYFVSVKVF